MSLVADQYDRVPVRRVSSRLDVHLGHEGARRVDHVVAERRGVRMHARRDAVSGVDDGRTLGHLRLLVDEDRAARFEVADDMDVVDDLLADVDRSPVVVECLLDGLDRALDTGAVAAR